MFPKSKFSAMFNKKDSPTRSSSISDRRSRVSPSPAPSDMSSIKEKIDVAPSPRVNPTKPPQARSSGYATPTKRKDVPPIGDIPLEGEQPEISALSIQDTASISQELPETGVNMVQSTSLITEEPDSINVNSSNTPPPQGMPKRERSLSMYSQWSYDFNAADSDSDGEVYATPMDGLSEVEEEDEEEENGKRHSIVHQSAIKAPWPTQEKGIVIENSHTPLHDTAGIPQDDSSHEVRRATVVSEITDVAKTPRARHGQVATMTMEQQAECLDADIIKCQEIIHLFLTSRMREAEAKALAADPEGSHMYIGNASCVIQAIKSMMTFDQEDLKAALEIARITSALAHSLRKSAGGVTSRLAGMVRGGTQTSYIQSMNKVQKHAELVYAETLLIKAVLGIVAGGDWVGLIKEA
ncbi:hypothetical protein QFC19_004053 [Naganishia cerealis]|uniref:Uncharacterized protein n=1 Tax=Naganishia cerealis TaxID=610337 RepID=A0ACC2VZL3_9TREE|nr:hypothetical protein QFC19_004053 [Naganishia cerealis]